MASKQSKGVKTLASPSPSPSPSKRPKKSNLSSPASCSNSSSAHQRTPNHPPEKARETALPSTSSESSESPLSLHSAAAKTDSDSTSPHKDGYDTLKLLKAVAAFRSKNGIAPTMVRGLPEFLKEVKDFVPKGLSVKQLSYKLRGLREKFRRTPCPGPDSADFDRSFYELGWKAWGEPRRLRARGNTSGSVKRNGKAVGTKNRREGAEESENDEDEEADWEAEESMELGNDEETELFEDGCAKLPDKDEVECPYKYLKHALEEFWIAKNLNLNILQLALQKVDSVQAKHLDEILMEITKDELRLKIEKNMLSNEIMNFLCSGM